MSCLIFRFGLIRISFSGWFADCLWFWLVFVSGVGFSNVFDFFCVFATLLFCLCLVFWVFGFPVVDFVFVWLPFWFGFVRVRWYFCDLLWCRFGFFQVWLFGFNLI